MSTTEQIDLLNGLKVDLVHRITELDDLETAKEIVVLLDHAKPKKAYALTQEDYDALERGRKDYEEGRFVSHEDFMAELEQWRAERNIKKPEAERRETFGMF